MLCIRKESLEPVNNRSSGFDVWLPQWGHPVGSLGQFCINFGRHSCPNWHCQNKNYCYACILKTDQHPYSLLDAAQRPLGNKLEDYYLFQLYSPNRRAPSPFLPAQPELFMIVPDISTKQTCHFSLLHHLVLAHHFLLDAIRQLNLDIAFQTPDAYPRRMDKCLLCFLRCCRSSFPTHDLGYADIATRNDLRPYFLGSDLHS